ncbi:hypothetical protein BB559_000170 [Furculomyces boomerangus]|uniref:Glutamine-dependent NAD(+) synthetase n=1 Tax=Furculomyces boomerangus TaxID=61424 RepID=A0A2T9Z614_9FUNG|nr:hypothetical protein BB559_000170 [Furculomyces boomerangus]
METTNESNKVYLKQYGLRLPFVGYSCQDHFFEVDTVLHSWEILATLLVDPELYGIIISTGMPVLYNNTLYNCTVIILNGQIILIRPKMWMASEGNFSELRWFTPWTFKAETVDFALPDLIKCINGQKTVKFGDAFIETNQCTIGIEMCEELFVPESPHIDMSLDGADIIINNSGTYFELRKLSKRVGMMKEATQKCGGIYVYGNQRGCDGDRTYFDGSPMILCNGEVLSIGMQFSLKEVQVISATIDINRVKSYRASSRSFSLQTSLRPIYPRIKVDFDFIPVDSKPTEPVIVKFLRPEEEINLGPACWMWDYLRRSNQGGFFLCLSGGIDSCSVAIMVYSMCYIVCNAAQMGDVKVISDLHKILGLGHGSTYIPSDPKELSNLILHTCYMSTNNSSNETRNRAVMLAAEIRSYHIDFNFDTVISTILALFYVLTNKKPKFVAHGGSNSENIALQNIQARLRMILAYFFASLLLWIRSRPKSLLVLGTTNMDESLRGYLTKYDNSSADINPIGAISKNELRKYISFACDYYGISILTLFLEATPSAELVPVPKFLVQSDEMEMGMTYNELYVFGRLRKLSLCGPYTMFTKLVKLWGSKMYIPVIAQKIKMFFYYYGVNRHKMSVLTPGFHVESHSSDDNRFDPRQMLYNCQWEWQFEKIDETTKQLLNNTNNF